MYLDISSIKNHDGGIKPFSFEFMPENSKSFIEKTSICQPICITGTVEHQNGNFILTGSGKAKLSAECDRCLSPVDLDIEFELDETFTNKLSSDIDYKDEIQLFSGDSIDLIDAVRKAIYLNLPMKVLCKESCKGICPICGKNLNVGVCDCSRESFDPRLAALRSLLTTDREV